MGAGSFLGQLSVRPELREHRHFSNTCRDYPDRTSLLHLQGKNSQIKSRNWCQLQGSKEIQKINKVCLLSQFPTNQLLMADNRLTGGLRGCVEAFLEYIPHVTCPSILAERMLCALSSQSALQTLRHSTGFPLRVICTENSGGQVPAGTIQVLARMVPAKALNWLQLAPKCWFYPYRLLQLQTLSQAFLEHRQPCL